PPPPTSLYPLSLHDALPISESPVAVHEEHVRVARPRQVLPSERERCGIDLDRHDHPPDPRPRAPALSCSPTPRLPPGTGDRLLGDRESTRLNSSHDQISYAV